MKEKTVLVSSQDYGKDEANTRALLQRHHRVHEEISAFSSDIGRLSSLATLMTKAANAHNVYF